MKVKICGITRFTDALIAAENGADAIGFVFYNKSKRYISPDKASDISKNLTPFILKIGVFVNEQPEEINRISKVARLNMVQLHGLEKPEFIKNINLPVIKSFNVNDNFAFEILNEYKNCYYLLDAYSKTELGGTGTTFNWSKIPNSLLNKIILAGGISENNIEPIFNKLKPAAVDLSSSVESEPGIKDEKLLINFLTKLNKLRYT